MEAAETGRELSVSSLLLPAPSQRNKGVCSVGKAGIREGSKSNEEKGMGKWCSTGMHKMVAGAGKVGRHKVHVKKQPRCSMA